MTRPPNGGGGFGRRLAHVGRQVPATMALGFRRLTRQKSPYQVTLSLTNRCNFRCDYCEIPNQHREEMSPDEWKLAIDQFRRAGMGRVSLIGGEPLLYRGVGEVIEHLRRRNVHAAMNTNGWFVEERIEDMVKLDLVCVTLDGPENVHDGQRRRGSYARAIGALDRLRRRGVPVVTMTVLTPSGVETIDHVLAVAREMGHLAYFQLEHDGRCDVEAPVAPKLADRRIAEVAKQLIDLKRAGLPVGNSEALLFTQRRQRLLGSCEDCYAGRYYAYVLSDGTVAPCLLTQWQQPRGLGRTAGFAAAFARMEPPQGPGCSCVPTHEVNRMLDLDVRVFWQALAMSLNPMDRT